MEEQKIPKLELSENQVVLPTIEIDLVVNGKTEKITLQKLPAGARRDIAKIHFQTKVVGNQMQSTPDVASFQIAILSRIIIEAPFPTHEKTIASFPDNVVDYLYNEYDNWANDSKKKD